MLENETNAIAVVASIKKRYDFDQDPRNWSSAEVDKIFTTHIEQMYIGDLVNLIQVTEEESPHIIKEYFEALCMEGKKNDRPKKLSWLGFLIELAKGILRTTMELEFELELAIAA